LADGLKQEHTMRRLSLYGFLIALLTSLIIPVHAEEWRSTQAIAGNFADTRDAVVMAIENRGLVINFTGHISEMLDRTASDLGHARRIYEQAEVLEFCSASLSRQMMEADPHEIVNCPFTIAVYSLAGDTRKTWVGYRKPEGKSAALLEKLLREIVAEALN